MILFVDFDGVLHPKGSDGVTKHFSQKSILEDLLLHTSCRHVQIVVSSTWREAYSIQKLREFFCLDLRHRIIDRTPVLDDLEADYLRYREIRSWLTNHRDVQRWCAIDDDREGFPELQRRRVVITDSSKGLTADNVPALRMLLTAK
jgi:hypothetical protein